MSTSAQEGIPRPIERAAPLRFITATSLFDGHDAAIHLIRRLLLAQGAEVVHLGHNRSVEDIVRAACQEDVDGVAISSYQGGHVEFFRYLVERLRAQGAGHIRVFGGGGATITAAEAEALEQDGVERVYRAEDGVRLGLEAMVGELLERTRRSPPGPDPEPPAGPDDHTAIGRALSLIERGAGFAEGGRVARSCPVLGVTGPGGSGKSTVIDELLARFLAAFPAMRVALIAIDPTRQRSGGALLADRLPMNSGCHPRVYLRSMATRRRHLATSAVLSPCLEFLRTLGFDLVLIETAGTGQGDTEIVDLVDVAVYVMADYGGPSQLEKIQMLDAAHAVVLNKRDKPGAADALRAVQDHLRTVSSEGGAVFDTSAHRFDDPGLERLFVALCERLSALGGADRWTPRWTTLAVRGRAPSQAPVSILPEGRLRYLSEIARQGREEREAIERQARAARRAQAYYLSSEALEAPDIPAPLAEFGGATADPDPVRAWLRDGYQTALVEIGEEGRELLRAWPEQAARYRAARLVYRVRDRDQDLANDTESQSGVPIPAVAVPIFEDWGTLLRFLLKENLPGSYPYTAGVYPRRHLEAPARMFAGEGGPERTNRRFHYLAGGAQTTRLSTAFDPVVLYGADPDTSPDVYGRLGMSGVSVATLDDVKKLYSGFDLGAPTTSVSMTINGPAPVLLAMYLNAAIDQAVEKHLRQAGRWTETEARLDPDRPSYRGPLPPGHGGLGLGLLGVSGAELLDPETYARIQADTLARLRGTVQADVLKEDQAQNECLFAIEFALSLMGDVEAYLIQNGMRHYYSVSVSGYHIGEAGANPVTQLAFTLANGFTLVEYFLARGLALDDFAPHLSFFFSNGLDAEYAVLGRVARRIWARALRHVYGAGPRGQMLKYHVQTSGRSLQAQDIAFNDIRTTLEALYAIADNCQSLHTNAYDEAITTPTEESVRRALAIQTIIRQELGQSANENPLQGSFYIEGLTDRVEEAVYTEFERLSERGGVLGAMEGLYQRTKIQDQGLDYEARKHDGRLPIAGVNTFLAPAKPEIKALTRASDAEKDAQIAELGRFHTRHRAETPKALGRLKDVVRSGGNTFAELMHTVRDCSLGQITEALYEVGGRYRRRI
ncbi:MAG: methylmalonyl-CoA mutase family protein [Gammaproteobacteria bacterium]